MELGGYTKIQQLIKLNNDLKQLALTLIISQGIIFLITTLVLYLLLDYVIATFFLIQAIIYSNYMWYYTSLDREKNYYIVLISSRLLLFFVSLLFIVDFNILPLLIIIIIGKIIFIQTTEKWNYRKITNDIKQFITVNKSIGTTNLITQLGNRMIDIIIIKVLPDQEIARIGLLKPILDKLGSLITQHIVNREIIRSIKKLDNQKLLQIFVISIVPLVITYVITILSREILPSINIKDLNILLGLLTLTILHAIVIRLVILREKEYVFVYSGLLIYSIVAILFTLNFIIDYFLLIGIILLFNLSTGLIILGGKKYEQINNIY